MLDILESYSTAFTTILQFFRSALGAAESQSSELTRTSPARSGGAGAERTRNVTTFKHRAILLYVDSPPFCR
jgi:hypothetical protein